jgi:hypothetical protein
MTDLRDAARIVRACVAIGERYGRPALTKERSGGLREVLHALDEFQECARYLNTRRSKGAVLELESEADVQDALYLMLRPWVHDIVTENPTDRTGNRFVIKDLLIPSLRTVIEAKFVRDKMHGRDDRR